ncbi:hypothetical protein [Geomicrobium sp. JCM 19039]|uniref:Gp37-like protein n=1 Tax=Geomicrobium sp. JCM 19039 TaxID=1460636 RepID=UPI0009DC9DB3|nr:hypothetical protein [Geomicrobium sp. JCM 19039]
MVYVAGQGDGAERRIVVVGDGLDRRESFVDARDVEEEIEDEETGEMVSRPVKDIDEELRQRGEEALAEKARKQSFTCQIIDGSPFKYEVDYDLGDIVTMQNRKWGVTLDARLEEIERDKSRLLSVTFGHDLPSFIKVIKREMRQSAR